MSWVGEGREPWHGAWLKIVLASRVSCMSQYMYVHCTLYVYVYVCTLYMYVYVCPHSLSSVCVCVVPLSQLRERMEIMKETRRVAKKLRSVRVQESSL